MSEDNLMPLDAIDAAAETTLDPTVTLEITVVTVAAFVDVHEDGAAALVGADGESALIPEGGDVMFYGDGGAGKTTLAIDLACHLAAGDPWLGIPIARPATVLLIENEGPRPHFRTKLRRKRAAWTGSTLGDRLLVLEAPWSTLTLNNATHREALAAKARELAVDVVIVGPVTRSGMNEAGTLQEVRDFTLHIADVRTRAGRPIAFVLVHHENKGGQVSGAWEGAGDTLFHVQGQGHGRTRLYIQKARWSSSHHGTSMQLTWTDGEGFTVTDTPERDDDTIADEILEAAGAHGGESWAIIAKGIPGKAERLREIRDRLLAGGRLVNSGSDARTKLWHADDPALQVALDGSDPRRDGSGTAQRSAPGEADHEPKPSPVPPIRDGDGDGSLLPPSQDDLEWA